MTNRRNLRERRFGATRLSLKESARLTRPFFSRERKTAAEDPKWLSRSEKSREELGLNLSSFRLLFRGKRTRMLFLEITKRDR